MLTARVQSGITRSGVCLSSPSVGCEFRPVLSTGLFYAHIRPAEQSSSRVSLCRPFSHEKTDRNTKTGWVKSSPASRQPPRATVRGEEGAANLQPKRAFTVAILCFPGNAAVVDLPIRHASGSTCGGTVLFYSTGRKTLEQGTPRTAKSEPNSSSRVTQ